jgi:hypothetical protein
MVMRYDVENTTHRLPAGGRCCGFNSPVTWKETHMSCIVQKRTNGRYLWELCIGGTREAPVIVGDVKAALKRELLDIWGWACDPSVPEPAAIGATLLAQWVSVMDAATKQPAAVLAFRQAKRGESRLPVAMVFDATTGEVRSSTIEEYERSRSTQAA